ncbi:MAG TPA: tRNA (adenosine(37)-N6)-dimethylallyltransferase MiaA [Bryobacteraceae bacterium]|nr:tRNA (adenosine(37)-N6)-dimethylallyltransferase MiaA [Bryobacteraceae bacterium]
MSTESLLIAVVGATGTGKSATALALAEAYDGEIVNCDSLQLYRYLDIGTAKVSAAERSRVPHHMLDVLDPPEVFTAGDYSRAARAVVRDIAARGRVPIVVGGTGFYLRALLNGLFEGPGSDPGLRERLARRPERLHRLLERLDPQSASRIHPNDHKKLIRALEVCFLARRPMSRAHLEEGRRPLEGFHVVKIGLNPPRELLKQRLDARTAQMFEMGLIDEVKGLLQRGYGKHTKALEAIGYRETVSYLNGELTLAQAIECAQVATRQYAKRQLTWFRRERDVVWLEQFGDLVQTKQLAISLIDEVQKNL